MQREALRGVSKREGGAAARGHSTTQHGPPRAGSETEGCAEPAARSPSQKDTPHYTLLFILHQPEEEGGFYTK